MPLDSEVTSPAAAVEELEAFNRRLWEMVDSDHSPFTAAAKLTTRERMQKALSANQELTAVVLRRFFESSCQ